MAKIKGHADFMVKEYHREEVAAKKGGKSLQLKDLKKGRIITLFINP